MTKYIRRIKLIKVFEKDIGACLINVERKFGNIYSLRTNLKLLSLICI